MKYFRKWYGMEIEEEITKGEALRLIAFVHKHGERLLGRICKRASCGWDGLLGVEGRVKMKTKLEKRMDVEFDKLGVKMRIFHFTEDVAPFSGITICNNWESSSWGNMRKTLDIVFKSEYIWVGYCCLATRIIRGLRSYHVYGVAICDKRDQFNRQRGRVIAKGRLLKRIKER